MGFKSDALGDVVKATRAGLTVVAMDALVKELAIKQKEAHKLLGVSSSTLERRRRSEDKRLSPQVSDRVYRLASVYEAAIRLFDGDREAARGWLNEPAKALGGNTPLDHLDTEAGADEVKELIGRLEHGVVS
jgi:putative toxin-antitoxin system antitoxin component (TIGR02293 family)